MLNQTELDLQEAIKAHRSGDLFSAEKIYRKIIKSDSYHSHANHNLGVLLKTRGNLRGSLEYFQNAIKSDPDEPQFWQSYIHTLFNLNELDKAQKCYFDALSAGHVAASFDSYLDKAPSLRRQIANNKELDDALMNATQEIKVAYKLVQQHKIKVAKNALLKVLTVWPYHKEARNLFEQLITDIPKHLEPSNEELKHHILAAKQGMSNLLLQLCDDSLKKYPQSSILHNLKGLAHQNLNDFDMAECTFQKAIQLNDKNAEAHNNLGNILFFKNDFHGAIINYQNATKVNRSYFLAYKNLGIAYQKINDQRNAIIAFKQAVKINPNEENLLNELTILLIENSKLEQAAKFAERALRINANSVNNLNAKGLVMYHTGRLKDALKMYTKALQISPQDSRVLTNIGNVFRLLDNYENAIKYYQLALSNDPQNSAIIFNIGLCKGELGDRTGAVCALEQACTIQIHNATYIRSLVRAKENQKTDIAILEKINLAIASTHELSGLSELYYAKHKFHHDVGDFQSAYEALSKGAAYRQKELKYDIEIDLSHLQDLIHFNKEIQEVKAYSGDESYIQPIFILGMPRSGTSFLEKLLSNHELFTAGGELEFFNNFMTKLLSGKVNLNQELIRMVRDQYLSELAFRYGRKTPFIIDKMPHNFKNILLIRKVFPQSKIIHIKRDKRSTCWSNYKEYFTTVGLGYSYNLDTTLEYYGHYQKYCDTIKLYDCDVIEIQYEDLLLNQDECLQILFEKLSIEYNTSDFSEPTINRPVRTASNFQVNESSAKFKTANWLNYSEFLPPSFMEL